MSFILLPKPKDIIKKSLPAVVPKPKVIPKVVVKQERKKETLVSKISKTGLLTIALPKDLKLVEGIKELTEQGSIGGITPRQLSVAPIEVKLLVDERTIEG
jgi:hypothetical protein